MTAQNRVDPARLRSTLLRPDGPYAALDVVTTTGSTNADLRAATDKGAADRTVLIAEEQTAGAGRRGRTWLSPSGTGVYCSVLLRPDEVPFAALNTLPLIAGLALIDLADDIGVDAALKWPNDVLSMPNGAKWAGILAESVSATEQVVVLGIGINVVPLGESVQPGPGGLHATSLAQQGSSTTDRTEVARLLLAFLDQQERRWRAGGGDLYRSGLLDDYRARCATLGHEVTVLVSGGPSRTGRAVDVDVTGALVLETSTGARDPILAGDVVHLRSALE